jgi:hypothetical protein
MIIGGIKNGAFKRGAAPLLKFSPLHLQGKGIKGIGQPDQQKNKKIKIVSFNGF